MGEVRFVGGGASTGSVSLVVGGATCFVGVVLATAPIMCM